MHPKNGKPFVLLFFVCSLVILPEYFHGSKIPHLIFWGLNFGSGDFLGFRFKLGSISWKSNRA